MVTIASRLATREGRAARRVVGGRPMETRAVYFRRRAAEERTAAANTSNLRAKGCHLELADAYDFRGREFAALDSQPDTGLLAHA